MRTLVLGRLVPLFVPLFVLNALLVFGNAWPTLWPRPALAVSIELDFAVAALVQMVWRHPLAGVAGRAIAVPGALFTAICLATGSIWGRPTWGTWWEWDGRMTSMLVLLFLYCGYIALARASAADGRGIGDNGGVSRVTAIFALVGAINLPIINRSVVWWNSLHQGPSITLRGSTIDMAILWPLGLTVLGFSLWFGAIVLMRMRAILAENKVEARLARMAREGMSGDAREGQPEGQVA